MAKKKKSKKSMMNPKDRNAGQLASTGGQVVGTKTKNAGKGNMGRFGGGGKKRGRG